MSETGSRNFGASHLNHIYDNAFDTRRRGFFYSNIADPVRDFDAYRAYELGWHRELNGADWRLLHARAQALRAELSSGLPASKDDPDRMQRLRARLKVIEEVFAADPPRPVARAVDGGGLSEVAYLSRDGEVVGYWAHGAFARSTYVDGVEHEFPYRSDPMLDQIDREEVCRLTAASGLRMRD